jgi:hypothetical protein
VWFSFGFAWRYRVFSLKLANCPQCPLTRWFGNVNTDVAASPQQPGRPEEAYEDEIAFYRSYQGCREAHDVRHLPFAGFLTSKNCSSSCLSLAPPLQALQATPAKYCVSTMSAKYRGGGVDTWGNSGHPLGGENEELNALPATIQSAALQYIYLQCNGYKTGAKMVEVLEDCQTSREVVRGFPCDGSPQQRGESCRPRFQAAWPPLLLA